MESKFGGIIHLRATVGEVGPSSNWHYCIIHRISEIISNQKNSNRNETNIEATPLQNYVKPITWPIDTLNAQSSEEEMTCL